MGRSIGHWEGQTLVAETISVKTGLWADFTPAMFSEKVHLRSEFGKSTKYARRPGDYH